MIELPPDAVHAAGLPMPEPAPIDELWIVAGLMFCPTCREWFREMGFTLGCLQNPACEALAAFALSGRQTVPRELGIALGVTDGRQSVGEWLCSRDVEAWAKDHGFLARMQVSLRTLKARWLPRLLRWCATQAEAENCNARFLDIAAQAAAFAAWDEHTPGKVWVYNPGEELRVAWEGGTRGG